MKIVGRDGLQANRTSVRCSVPFLSSSFSIVEVSSMATNRRSILRATWGHPDKGVASRMELMPEGDGQNDV
tara:strand:- start:200 stop:412 length:213 start_codon:yes stop_codon:yes gene_type:complete